AFVIWLVLLCFWIVSAWLAAPVAAQLVMQAVVIVLGLAVSVLYEPINRAKGVVFNLPFWTLVISFALIAVVSEQLLPVENREWRAVIIGAMLGLGGGGTLWGLARLLGPYREETI